jgi:hypothetical protein
MVNGESHYFFGQRYRLRVHEQYAPPRVAVRGIASLDLFVRPGMYGARHQVNSGTYSLPDFLRGGLTLAARPVKDTAR